MSDITVAIDETGASQLLSAAQAALSPLSRSGTGNLGPFNASWSASASISGGSVNLIAPDIFRLTNIRLNYSVSFSISFDLSTILPDFCLPQVCIPIPFNGRICTPRICVDWPSITIPVSHSGFVNFTSDFRLRTNLSGGNWLVDVVIVGVPFLQLDVASAAILTAIGVAAGLALAVIPFIGPFLAGAVVAISVAIGVAGVTGFLGPILTPFVSGLAFNIYKQPQVFPVLPASPPDGAMNIRLDAIQATIIASDEDELVITADISAP